MIDKEGKIDLNWSDDLITGTCIAYDGEIKNERVKGMIQPVKTEN